MPPVETGVIELNRNNILGNVTTNVENYEVAMNNKEIALSDVTDIVVEISKLKKIERASYFAIKRFFDIIASVFGILAIIPVAIIAKICYVASGDKKSIFYKQQRIGKNGKKIHIYKFRSMVHNADEVLQELLKNPEYKKEWDLNQKFEKDPRVTRLGNALRKTSLDELPQFINVLKGDMSLIGPRPLVVGELDSHNGSHEVYESVRPGVSGWWACNGRSATTYEKRLELEYYYCMHCNLWLDLKCIFLTIKAVLFKDGAK